MFAWFEQRIEPFKAGAITRPPAQLWPFYWHYCRQIWHWLGLAMIFSLIGSLIEVSLFAFLGSLVDRIKDASSADAFFDDNLWFLLAMATIALIVRPVIFAIHTLLINQTINPNFTNLVRWQTHRYVLRQSLGFFQNDFAGRIANKIMQTGPSLRESVVQIVGSLWFVMIYAVSAMVLFAQNDIRLTLPLLIWIGCFVACLGYFVPKIKNRAAIMSEARSALAGRIVDSYGNINTVKLFAHADREDDYARAALEDHNNKLNAQLRMITAMESTIWTLNGFLIVMTTGLALWLWGQGLITVGVIALTIGLVLRINNMAGWIMWVVTGIFENIGTVQEGMTTIAQTYDVVDRPGAKPLSIKAGRIDYQNVRFHYGNERKVIDGLSLVIEPGEKIGLVGRSGAGKSTLVSLLMRFYDLESGSVHIDGQDIRAVTQESLRAGIGMVTQDTSLLHRSVHDNIVYGRPDVSRDDAVQASIKAQAHDFILDLEDGRGRRSYEAHVGERGVKLSGGQRQRIAIARVLLKNAPILILDEATASLDSEAEAAIQDQLANLMEGKTVIAIAHRLSTIAAMDRLVIMDEGKIVETGTHQQLLDRDGLYSRFWARQSGGFIAKDVAA